MLIDPTTRLRADGRAPDQMMPPFLDRGTLSRSSGSAYMEWQGTKLVCGVHGPRPTNKPEYSDSGRLRCDVRIAQFANKVRDVNWRPPPAPPTKKERDLSAKLQTALDSAVVLSSFPKSAVDVYIWVIEDGCSVLESAIASASLSLAQSGVELLDLVTSCSTGIADDSVIILDPSQAERAECRCVLTLACMPSLDGSVCLLDQVGKTTVDEMTEAVSLCIAGCEKLRETIADMLKSV